MASVVEATGKTVADALKSALQQLGCTEVDVDYEVLEEPSKGFLGFFGKDAKVKVTKKETVVEKAVVKEVKAEAEVKTAVPAAEEKNAVVKDYPSATEQLARAEKFLRDVFAAMNIEVTWQQSEAEDGVVFNLEGDNLGILIGKHGQTLDSLQYLVNLTANRGVAEGRVRIIIDIEGYRSRREETLMRLAGHLAEKACRIGEEVHLEPMNRHERKIIHMALQDNRRVSTYSTGDEPRRYVVIVPRRRRRRRGFDEQERYNED
ncbi:putative single-stranded nucleic acid binding protein [Selenomonas ruminantium subsp. lactilytica TAM6421]|uniref:RNA-binding protein KhpB n=1 Tax=Selenomonas ruminantium subsp. lactilytica (strain NBRC 103574 / TAM6421) TaxID=927704 RepID=I0GUU3_SELRL|nr:RNA-binding cell elongation regulator Jag/EloR [Selenomonas ruminantium]BAL84530.1 putative single-stranded nucleic acid binding protein [Selenomonas ruminantium subsp. lactilytica TAM6421]